MWETAISSSILIIALIVLRALAGEKISARLRCALWLLVALRLLLPFSGWQSGLSVMNLLTPAAAEQTAYFSTENDVEQVATAENLTDDQESMTLGQQSVFDNSSVINVESILKIAALCGTAAIGVYFALKNLAFSRKLRAGSRRIECVGASVPVYRCDALPSPCVFGVLRPAIYLNAAVFSNENTLRCALAHEQAHIRRGDQLWALVRAVCVCVWWFNPLVWAAARLSADDCERAADEAVLKSGRVTREGYGFALLNAASRGTTAMPSAAVPMSGRGSLEKRIRAIASSGKKSIAASIAVVLCAALLVSCTFSSAKSEAVFADVCAAYDAREQADGSVLLACEQGSDVYAPRDAQVTMVDENAGELTLATDVGTVTLGGLESIAVAQQQKVSRGDVIASAGDGAALGQSQSCISLLVCDGDKPLEAFEYISPYSIFRFGQSSGMITPLGESAYFGSNEALGAWHEHINLNVFDDPQSVRIYTDAALKNELTQSDAEDYYAPQGKPNETLVCHFGGGDGFQLYDYAIFPAFADVDTEDYYIVMSWADGRTITRHITAKNLGVKA